MSLLLVIIVSPIITNLLTRAVERWETKIGLVGEDVHKMPGRFLPKSGGLGFLLGWSVSIGIYSLIALAESFELSLIENILIGMLLVWISGLIGLYDDFKRLGGIEKVILTAIPGVILALLGLYEPYVYVPMMGNLRMTIVYPLLLPIIFAVASNAINMSDTFTGIAPGITGILSVTILGVMFLQDSYIFYWQNYRDPAFILILTAILSLLGYIPRNLYPGKTFNGDVGSLSWGALLALGAIWGKVEFFLVLASMPIVANGFTILSSIKRIIEHHELKERPTIPNREKNTLRANTKKDAPITLAHMLTLKNELCEKEIVIAVYLLVVFTSFLAFLTAYISFR